MQGLTEFLPVSSSGHLVIGQRLFAMQEASLFLDTILHLGTLAAVFVVFRVDLWRMTLALASPLRLGWRGAWREDAYFRLVAFLVVGTIPAGLAGVLLEDTFEQAFGSTRAVGIALFITAGILFASRWAKNTTTPIGELTMRQTIGVGVAQALAITPGISRSGSTIVAGLLLGLDRDAAGRLSFLLAIPAILGAVVLQAAKLESLPAGFVGAAVTGFVVAALSGYLALKLLLSFVRGGQLHWFGVYCLAAGAFALLI